ncbi:MAG: hypothetical protein H9W81_08820 [Enterococcus sp.]|nr:hypothetical protein [Enterococcus sp.]
MRYLEAVKLANTAEVKTQAKDIETNLRNEFPEWQQFITVTPVVGFNYANSKPSFRVSVNARNHWAASNDHSAYGHIINHEALDGMSEGFNIDESMDAIRDWTKMAVLAPFNFDPKYL